MKITVEDRLIASYTAQRLRLRDREDEDYRARVESEVFQKIIIDRVRRNLRLDLDKGTNVDLDV
jgi:hypothetical protein